MGSLQKLLTAVRSLFPEFHTKVDLQRGQKLEVDLQAAGFSKEIIALLPDIAMLTLLVMTPTFLSLRTSNTMPHFGSTEKFSSHPDF